MATPPTQLRARLRALVIRKTGVGEVDFARFKQLRVKLGITQLEVADLIGVDRTALTSWERGSKAPTPDHAKAVAEVLDEMERLVGGGS